MTNNKYKILFIEDEDNICTFVSALLDANGYQPIIANNLSEAKLVYFSHVPDLVILDLGLPDGDGSVFLSEVRKNDATPIIVLSARGDEGEKVRLLDMGANDYITKPFGSAELLARVRSSLRSFRHSADAGKLPGGKFTLDELEIDYDARRIFLSGEEIKLTQTEYNILALLSEHSGKMMTYASIIKEVWREFPADGNIKRLQVNMANIRKKLKLHPGDNKYIINELGVGYRLQDGN